MSNFHVMVRHSRVPLMQTAALIVARRMGAVTFLGPRFVKRVISSSMLIRYKF